VEPGAQRAKLRRAFDAHFDALNRYCLRRIAADDVNDVVSEVFVVAWRKIDKMPDEPESLPWLYRVARNEISNRRRSTRRLQALRARVGGLANHPEPGPELIVVRNEQHARVRKALSEPRSSDQEILLLRTHEELDYDQISVAVGCTPEAARKRVARALRRLPSATDLEVVARAEPIGQESPEGGLP
jgi:RNA polymerase sigma-70 factor (ECF subfamily)